MGRRLGIPWGLLLVLVLLPGLFSALVLDVSLGSSRRAVEAERSARRSSELAFCQLVSLLDDAYKATPPKTPTGIAVARAMANLRVANSCP